jgi:hypothetical protein
MSVGRVQQQQGGLAIGVLNLDSRPPQVALEELGSIEGPVDRVASRRCTSPLARLASTCEH